MTERSSGPAATARACGRAGVWHLAGPAFLSRDRQEYFDSVVHEPGKPAIAPQLLTKLDEHQGLDCPAPCYAYA